MGTAHDRRADSQPLQTAVGMSGYLMHSDPSVYENPFDFVPERWLGDIHPNLMRNFVPFSRGLWGLPPPPRHSTDRVLTGTQGPGIVWARIWRRRRSASRSPCSSARAARGWSCSRLMRRIPITCMTTWSRCPGSIPKAFGSRFDDDVCCVVPVGLSDPSRWRLKDTDEIPFHDSISFS